jgi:hypothetical protein
MGSNGYVLWEMEPKCRKWQELENVKRMYGECMENMYGECMEKWQELDQGVHYGAHSPLRHYTWSPLTTTALSLEPTHHYATARGVRTGTMLLHLLEVLTWLAYLTLSIMI